MKKIIFVFAVALSFTCFAQKTYKCFKNDYEVVGGLTHTEKSGASVVNYYAGIKDGKVHFTEVQLMGSNVQQVWVETMPVNKVSLKFNDMFSSRSKTKTEKGYTLLTLGAVFSNRATVVNVLKDLCYLRSETLGVKKSRSLIMDTKFTSKAKLLELTDKIKSLK